MSGNAKYVKVSIQSATAKVGSLNGYTVVGDWLVVNGRNLLLERPAQVTTAPKTRTRRGAVAAAVAAAAFPPPNVKEA